MDKLPNLPNISLEIEAKVKIIFKNTKTLTLIVTGINKLEFF